MHLPKDGACPMQNETADVSCRTIFVRNLPYNLLDSELQEIFSEIGPVRRSFTVKEKGNDQHRGFGFVQFAVPEDAIRAVQEKDGTSLQGRKIMVTLAKRRVPFERRHSKKSIEPETSQNDDSQKTPLAPKGNNKKKIINSGSDKNENQDDRRYASKEVSSKTSDIASEEKSSVKVVPGVSRKRKSKHDVSVVKERKKKKVVVDEKKCSDKQRIARTVVFGGLLNPEMREEVIERAKKIGPVESVQSSLSPQELKGRGLERDGCKLGAAAIVYASVKAACKAVATFHGNAIGGAAVWARQLGGEGGKPRKLRVIVRNLPFKITEDRIRELFSSAGFVWEVNLPRKPDGQSKGFAFVSFISKANAEKAIITLNGTILEKRTIAVDWAVERNVYKLNASVDNSEDKGEGIPSDIENEETASESGENHVNEEEISSDPEPSMVQELDMAKNVLNKIVSSQKPSKNESKTFEHDTNVTINEITQGLKSSIEERLAGQHKNKKRGDLNKTVFIKNLPLDVHADDVRTHFSTFGKVKSVYLVVHPNTKRPKGTAFLEFLSQQAAEAAVAAARGTFDNGYTTNGVVIGGRKLEVLEAMEKKSAKAIEQKKHENANIDRRNLYLAEEGKIVGTTAAAGVSEEDMRKRAQLEQEKATKLRSPSFHVSRTRLAVYNVPQSMNESDLETLFINAVKSRATKQNPVIKKVIILKDKSKGNKTRGVAFVEFSEHEHALVALRVLNNNPETFVPERRPIIGFALENLQKLKKQQQQRLGIADKICKTEAVKGRKSEKVDDVKVKASKGVLGNKTKQGDKRKRKSEKENDIPGDSVDMDGESGQRTKKQKSLERKERDDSLGSARQAGNQRNNQKAARGVISSSKQIMGSQKRTQKQNTLERKDKTNGPSSSIHTERKQRNNKNHDSNRLPKSSQKRKSSNIEIEDKLDELVAKYRKNYFSHSSTAESMVFGKSSSDIKRWFD